MPRWTDEQKKAIDEEGKNIIVSAGAGSGKTAVLTARVLRKLNSGVNINELLILTFTKAAAHEMKERIRKEIKKDETLKSQLDMIDAAYITTFDSYSLSVVKKYYYLLNVSQNVGIADASIIDLKKEEIIEEIFNELYLEKNPKFLKLISDFCLKDDANIKKYIIEINNKLDMLYDKVTYLDNYLDNFFDAEKINEDIKLYEGIIIKKISLVEDLLKDLSSYVAGDYYANVSDLLEPLIISRSYIDIKNAIITKLPNLPRNTDEEAKKIKEEIVKNLKSINELCSYLSVDEIFNSITITKDYIDIIKEIILKLDERLIEFKWEKDVFEFVDIAKMAIEVVESNEEVRNEIKESFQEILVDEYQDTNDLQEKFISLISKDNVYMVGDIKQSIYRFRNANPNIFREKYNNYSQNLGGEKIDLNKNFRSRREVLDNINEVFKLIMDEEVGGADYQVSHQMIFGNTTYEENGNTNQDNNFEILNYEYDKELGYQKEEIEAFIIASDIKRKVDGHYQVFDKDTLLKRDIEYRDFVILMDRTTNFLLYKKIFEYLMIPLNVSKDEVINNGMDIYVIKNILKLIKKSVEQVYDEEFKYAFVSVARSFLFCYDDEEIFLMLKEKKYFNSKIMEKVKVILKNINVYNNYELIKRVIEEFDIYNNLIKVGGIADAMVRIEYLERLAKGLNSIGYGINEFINYLDDIIKKDIDIKYSPNEVDTNSVKIMTIHKSKGLEYHLCYYPGLYKEFNISDLKSMFVYDNVFGIITPFKDNSGIHNTIYKTLLKEKYLSEEIAEKIRLFYVALTRAKEKMIFVCPTFEDNFFRTKANGVINDSTRLKYSSFYDILASIKSSLDKYIKIIDLKDISLSKDYNLIKTNNYKDSIKKDSIDIEFREIKIENKTLTKSKFSKNTHDLAQKQEKDNMKFGEYMHYLLEVIDFKNPNLEDININSFYKSKIKKFLENDILKDIKKANIYKEYEFSDFDGEKVSHGIIDLMLEYNDKIIIIDYKLKNVLDDAYIKQLNGYKEFIKKKTNKPISIYLYSIMEERFKEILDEVNV